MTDQAEQFRNIPIFRKMLADPLTTSRKMEDLRDLFEQKLRETPALNTSTISNDRVAEMLSSAIQNNQRDYQDLSYNIDNLNDTYQDVWFEMQRRMDEEIAEMQWLKKQMQTSNSLAKKRLDALEKKNEYLDNIDQNTSETNLRISRNTESIEDLKNRLSKDFSETKNYLSSIHTAQNRIWEVSLGIRIPEIKWISELMENADFEWKKTLLALYAKGLVNDGDDWRHALSRVFSSYFWDYLRKNMTSEETREICQEIKEEVKKLENEYTNRHDELKSQKKSESDIFQELTPLRNKISQASEWLIPDDEIELLDFYQEAKNAEDIIDLINMWLLDDSTLEKLIRHQKVDGESSLQIARIMKIDENGVNPKTQLDGDVGRRQHGEALKIQWNIALNQRQAMIESLEEWNELKRITNDILLEMKDDLTNALCGIGDVLQNIGDTLMYGFNQISEGLQSIREVNQNIFEELQIQTQLLEDIKTTLLNPLDTKANEFYKQWVFRAETKNRSNAFNNFRKWLDEKDNHLWNLYGAATAKMMLWEDKEAAKYLLRAYQVAKKEAKQEVVSKIALDIAKINTKYLRLKLAKRRLDEAIKNDKWNMEAFLLKARITKMLGQKKELEELIQIIYNEIICEGNDKDIPKSYWDIFKHFHKPIDIVTEEEITSGWTFKLIKILPRVNKIWYITGMKKILWELLEKNPMGVKKAWINTQEMLQTDTDFFNKKYKEIALRHYTWGKSIDLFALAYIGYQHIDTKVINHIIKTWLEFDIDYINLKNEMDMQKKKISLKNIKDKIYALGDNAKYMLRDYLQNNPNSLLNI